MLWSGMAALERAEAAVIWLRTFGRAGPLCIGDSLTSAKYPTFLSLLIGRRADRCAKGGAASSEILQLYRALPRSTVHERPRVIWVGRNNYEDADRVLGDVAELARGTDRYVVLSVINGDLPGEEAGGERHAMVQALNARLSAEHEGRYVDVRTPLVRAGSSDDRHRDIPSRRLRVDPVHLNKTGYLLVAKTVAAALRRQTWA